MKIALLGYGKMGKEIEQIALDRQHEIVLKIDVGNQADMNTANLQKADVAIDFSVPTSAYDNIMKCFEAGVPIVCGTTGWLEKFDEVMQACQEKGQTFFYASNYSVGVNLFFHLNKHFAKVMDKYAQYDVAMEEVHHTQKLDAPSGTAITLAEGILQNVERKTAWKLEKAESEQDLKIAAIREGQVPGIHSIRYDSDMDYIEIKHSAKSRKGFAHGAVVAAEFLQGKKGYYTMDDLMELK